MAEVRNAVIPWRECQFVSPRNACRILGLRQGALNDRIRAGVLEAKRLPGGQQIVISVESVSRLVEQSEAVQLTARKEAERQRKTRPFRLVINNN